MFYFNIAKLIIVYNSVCMCVHEAEWREGAQVLAAMVHLNMLCSRLPYI